MSWCRCSVKCSCYRELQRVLTLKLFNMLFSALAWCYTYVLGVKTWRFLSQLRNFPGSTHTTSTWRYGWGRRQQSNATTHSGTALLTVPEPVYVKLTSAVTLALTAARSQVVIYTNGTSLSARAPMWKRGERRRERGKRTYLSWRKEQNKPRVAQSPSCSV